MIACLSLVIPVFNEEGSLKKLYEEINNSLQKLIEGKIIGNYEICFVSDGSTDRSELIIRELCLNDSHVCLICFRRNFGKSRALQAGFRRVHGDVILTMDADLQDDPKEFKKFLDKIEAGADLVSGWKFNRLDPLEKKIPSKLFNFVTSKCSGIALHDFNCGFKAYRREVVDNINVYGEFHRYIPVLALRNGFKVEEIPVEHHKRSFGKSKFGAERYLRGLFDAFSALFLLKYWDRPMYFFGKIGLVLFLIGFLICSYLSLLWFSGQAIGGRPLLVLGVLFILIGVQAVLIGLVANIIVDAAVKKSDDACIREIVGGKNEL